MPRLRIDVPVWLKAAARVQRARFPVLGRNLAVDVAVVGGGITGAAVAWRFAEAGVSVALVEGRRIGRGSTAASTALLMQEPDEDFAGLVERYGRKRSKRICQLSRKATLEMIETLNRLAIACDLERRDSVYGGNGMTMGFLAARLLLDWYRGDRSADHELFAFSR